VASLAKPSRIDFDQVLYNFRVSEIDSDHLNTQRGDVGYKGIDIQQSRRV